VEDIEEGSEEEFQQKPKGDGKKRGKGFTKETLQETFGSNFKMSPEMEAQLN